MPVKSYESPIRITQSISSNSSLKMSVVNPFDISGSSEDIQTFDLALPVESAEPDSVENQEFYRICNPLDQGVIYDDENIQIGIKLTRQDEFLFAIMYIGNKSSIVITDLRTEIIAYPHEGLDLAIDIEHSNEPILPKSQTCRQLKANITKFTHKSPKLILSLRQDRVRNLCLKLPITILRVFQGILTDPVSI